MGWILFLLFLGAVYVGAGFLVTFINAQGRGDTFKVDWEKILKWPAEVFGK